MLDIQRLEELIQKRITKIQERSNWDNERNHALLDAYYDIMGLIPQLQLEWQDKNNIGYVCTCTTIRCDECIIRDK